MASIQDDRGYNQGFELVQSTEVRMKRRAEWMMACMQSTQTGDVLEIGAGTGEVSYWIAQHTPHRVLSTDVCVPFIDSAKQKYQLPNLQFEVMDFTNPTQVNGRQFDYIIGNGILHHLYHHLDATLTHFNTLLNDGGKIIFMEPNIYNPYCALIFNIPYLRHKAHLEPDEMAFSKRFITKKLQGAQFHNINVSYRDFLLPGVPTWAIQPSIIIGDLIEKIPMLNMLAQSIFIVAEK